jgi:pimeloyl-ACP methyl ester carboxylesterase
LINSAILAKGMANETYTPPLPARETDALATIFDYQNGVKIEHDIIQYLNERSVNEVTWLETLARSDIPTTLIWGEKDSIAPTAVPDYVWQHYLKNRPGSVTYWRIPCANHYVQYDQPELLASIIRSTLQSSTNISRIPDADCLPIQVK